MPDGGPAAWHLFTLEAMQLLRGRLAADGVLVIQFIGDDGPWSASLVRTVTGHLARVIAPCWPLRRIAARSAHGGYSSAAIGCRNRPADPPGRLVPHHGGPGNCLPMACC